MEIHKPKINTTLKASSNLISKKETIKTRILLVDSERFDINHYYNSFVLLKKCPNYTVDRDGKIYEHVPSIYSASYYKKDLDFLNKTSIIIALNNCGGLVFDNNNNKYKNWINEYIEEEEVFEFKWRRFTYWENYKTKQLSSLSKLISYLCETHSIAFNSPFMDGMTHDNGIEVKGIISESNLYKTSCQVNPSFSWDYLFM